ncbi:MAG: WbqC family protein [Negativicutes bacterium]|nr:WbqC family protein [Negativicutes bacterium]
MILTAHQPAYLPWLGYFDKIASSDIFVYLDKVQFEKNSYVNRNLIKTGQGPLWLTIPVKMKGHMSKTIIDMEIDYANNWKKKHLSSIFLNYKKTPQFEVKYSKIEDLYRKDYQYISELLWDQLMFWINELNIDTKIVRMSDLSIKSTKSDLVLDLCKYFDASTYGSGALGRDYLEEDKFQASNIRITFQDYQYPVYPQLWGEFLPNLSIVDYWMNTEQNSLIFQGGRNIELFK